jgi:hypothetical protein
MAGTIARTFVLRIVTDSKAAEKGMGKLKKVAAGAAIVGIGALTVATIEGIKAFRKEQDIIRAFTRTVKSMRMPLGRTTAVMDRMADRAVNLGFDDAETIQGMSNFLRLTGDIDKAARLSALAFDIARSKGIDLAAAQKIAAGIYKGSARALKDYGLEGVKGMDAVSKAAAKEKGQAKVWARNHPMLVIVGRISDAWADLVGNLAEADFSGATAAASKIGDAIQDALFGGKGKNGIRDSTTAGLVNQAGAWGKKMAEGILTGIGQVDWLKTIQDTLNTALGALATAADSGALTNIAVLGTALALGIFGIRFFIDAASKMFGLPRWALGAGAKAAGAVVGKAFRLAMFLTSAAIDAFVGAASFMFTKLGTSKVLLSVIGIAGKALGIALQGAVVGGFAVGLAVLLAGAYLAALPPEAQAELKGLTPHPQYRSSDAQYGAYLRSSYGGFSSAGKAMADDWLKRHPGHAFGTAGSPGGLRWVGERGPELLNLRPGTQVMNSQASARAMGGGATVVNVNVNVPPTADKARIGQEIASALDAFFGRGGRFRYRPVGGNI